MSKMYVCFKSSYKKLASSFLLFSFILQGCILGDSKENGMHRKGVNASVNDRDKVGEENYEANMKDDNINNTVENEFNNTQTTEFNLPSDTNRAGGVIQNRLVEASEKKYSLKYVIGAGVVSGVACIGLTAGGVAIYNAVQKPSAQSSYSESNGSNGIPTAVGDSLACSCDSLRTCTTSLGTSTSSLANMTSRFNTCNVTLTTANTNAATLATNLFNCNSSLNGYKPSSTYIAGCVDKLNGNTTAGITGYISQWSTLMTQLYGDGSFALPGVYNLLNGNSTLTGGSLTGYISQWSTLMTSLYGDGTNSVPGCLNSLNGNSTLAGGAVVGYTARYNTCNTALNGDGTWQNPGYYGLVNGYTIGGQSVVGYAANNTACDIALNGGNGNPGCTANYNTYMSLHASKTAAFDNLTVAFSNLTVINTGLLSNSAACTQNSNILNGYYAGSTFIPGALANLTSCSNSLNGYQLPSSSYTPGCNDYLYGNSSAGITGSQALYGQLSGSTYTPGCIDELKGYYSTHVSPNQQYGCLSTLSGNSSTINGLTGITGYISQLTTLINDLYGDGTSTNPGCNNTLNGNSSLIGGAINGVSNDLIDSNNLLNGYTDSNGNYYPGCLPQLNGYLNSNSAYVPGCNDLLNGNSAQSIPSYLVKLDDMCLAYTLNSTTTPYCTTIFGGICDTCTGTCSNTSNIISCTSCTDCRVSGVLSIATGTSCTECNFNLGSTDSGHCNTCSSYLLS